jgi:hypothetical protein
VGAGFEGSTKVQVAPKKDVYRYRRRSAHYILLSFGDEVVIEGAHHSSQYCSRHMHYCCPRAKLKNINTENDRMFCPYRETLLKRRRTKC